MPDEVVHLRLCTEYSLLYSAARAARIADRAASEGMSALGFADRGGMFGTVSAYRAIARRGLAPVIGSVVAVADGEGGAPGSSPELCLIADSPDGYASLTRLATLAARRDRGAGPFNLWSEIREHRAGLLCLTGGLRGPLGPAVARADAREAARALRDLASLFGEGRLYVELMDHGLDEEAEANRRFAKLARHVGVPVVATAEIRHENEEDVALIDILQAVRDGGESLAEAAAKRPAAARYPFRSPEALRRMFAEYPDALAATSEIARRAAFELPLGRLSLPRYPLEPGTSEDGELRRLSFEGLRERGKEGIPEYRGRLEQELDVIQGMGFAGYFLVVWDFMRFAHEQGISTGPGRGSAAGSLTAYVLRITDVDPVEFGLLFERFLNPERVSLPDIDIDFETERRYEVIEYVARRYGEERVAQIGTFGTFAARAAIRDVARVLGAEGSGVDEAVRRIHAGPGVTIDGAMRADARLEEMVRKSPALARVFAFARALEGLPRHASVHAAGVVISRDSLADILAVTPGPGGVPVTQCAMEDVEALGLLKMDFLGLRTLTLCDRALGYVRATRGLRLAYPDLAGNGEALKLLAAGDTDGCFQLESDGVKRVLKEMRPEGLEDLIAVISLYRPGPMEQIGEFLRARRTPGHQHAVAELAPDLAPILAPTHGVLVYQEQIMQISAVMAGFSLGQADLLRRAVAKKDREDLARGREAFVAGCAARGYPELVADQVYDLIVRFADYGFNRSHAAAYAVLAMRTAHLKANFRPEFMAALITDSVSRPDKVAQYALECRRAGIPLYPPDIHRSQAETVPESGEGGQIGVRLGLFVIRNVGASAVEAILRERAGQGPFRDLRDLLRRLDARAATRRTVESLIQSGACDALGASRAGMLRELAELEARRTRRSSAQIEWLPDGALSSPGRPGEPGDHGSFRGSQDPGVRGPDASEDRDDPREREEWEKQLIGFVVSSDPYGQTLRLQRIFGARPLAQERSSCGGAGAETARLVGRIAKVRETRTRRGEPMAFLTLEDATDRVEVVVFPTLWNSLRDLPEAGRTAMAAARCEPGPKPSWIASSVKLFSPGEASSREPSDASLYLAVSAGLEGDPARLEQLRSLLVRHPGTTRVTLVYASGKIRPLGAVRVSLDRALREGLSEFVGREGFMLA